MHPAHAGSLSMLGAERVLGKNALRITIRFKEALDPARVLDAWERQIAARPTLRSRLKAEDGLRRRYIWVLYREGDLTQQLATEHRDVERPVDATTLDEHARRQQCLPFRLRLMDKHTLVALVDPMFTSAVGGASWVEDWLGFYRDSSGQVPRLATALQTMRRPPRQLSALDRLLTPVHALRWFGAECRRAMLPARRVVDLSDGTSTLAIPEEGAPPSRTITWRHVFDDESSRRLARGKSARGRTLTVQLLVATARLLLEVSPTRRLARVALDVDLSHWLPEHRRALPGNTSCCVEFPLKRRKPLLPQALRTYRTLVQGTHCRMRCRRLRLVRSEERFVNRVARRARKGRMQNAPVTDASVLICNLGRHAELRRLERDADWMSVSRPAPTISVTTVLVASTLTLEVCFPEDRYDTERLLALAERLPGMLLEGCDE